MMKPSGGSDNRIVARGLFCCVSHLLFAFHDRVSAILAIDIWQRCPSIESNSMQWVRLGFLIRLFLHCIFRYSTTWIFTQISNHHCLHRLVVSVSLSGMLYLLCTEQALGSKYQIQSISKLKQKRKSGNGSREKDNVFSAFLFPQQKLSPARRQQTISPHHSL